ncbi:MAG: DUF1150 family protein [Pseudomonadota bacterium]
MPVNAIDTKTAAFAAENLVYIKRLESEDVAEMVAPNMLEQVDDPDDLFAVYGPEGQPLAIVEGREAAFEAARAHSFKPYSVH